jgi:hypothetical protein
MRSGCTAALLLTGLIASTALAHPSPAEPPAFFAADCIIVVDKRAQASWHLDYAVVTDDIEAELDHVSLADSKTHQFFALSGTLFERATTQEILLFDDDDGVVRPMPTWLSSDDVMRTAAGVKPEDMTSFAADQVAAQDILESDPVLSSAVRPLVAGTARVPITGDAASAGVTWDLTDVPPGAYQIAAYIFSPPYNGWVARPGLIKVVDGALDTEAPPAVMLESVAGRVFAGQGRRVRGCVDAPEGSTLEVSKRAQAEVAGAFEPWMMLPVSNGAFELCLDNDGLSAALELRVEVRTPQGLLAATQSSDAISLFSNAAACVESELLCCPAGSAVGADAGGARDASMPMTPAAPDSGVDGAGSDGTVVPLPPDGSTSEAGAPAQPIPGDAAMSGGGCTVSNRPMRGSVAFVALMLMLVIARCRRNGGCAHDPKAVSNGVRGCARGGSVHRQWRG